MIVSANAWKKYYIDLCTNTESNNHIEAFKQSTELEDPEAFEDHIINNLRKDEDSIIMSKSPFTRNMKLLHSIKDLGGTRFRETHKIVGIEGFGPIGTPVAFMMNSIPNTISIDVPTDEQLIGIANEGMVQQTQATADNKFENATFVILPPFLSNPFVEMNTKDPAELLAATISLITEFDAAHPDFPNNKKARTQALYVAKFLWCAAHDHLDPLYFTVDQDDMEIETWNKKRHDNCILPSNPNITTRNVPRGMPPPQQDTAAIHALANNVKEQADILERMRQDKSAERDEKKIKFDKLHDSTKNLILQASSPNRECTPLSPVKTCTNFYEKTTVAKAMDYLKMVMKEKLNCSVDISTGLVTALYTGKFTRERDDAPCNFSFFMVPKLKPLSSGFQEKATFLQLKATQGQGWETLDIKEAIKQGIITPSTISEFEHQLKNLWGLSVFFFGETSVLPEALALFLQLCQRNSVSIEAKQERDPDFFTKLGYKIDTYVYRWLESCMRAEDREEVNDSLLRLTRVMDSILLDEFHQTLPLTFSSFKRKSPEDKNGNEKKRFKEGKEKEEDEKEKNRPEKVENTGRIENWLCTDSTEFKEKFVGKNSDKRPKINGKLACQRFHTKGFCYSNCRNVTTHIPSKQLSEDVKTKYAEYVSLCKA